MSRSKSREERRPPALQAKPFNPEIKRSLGVIIVFIMAAIMFLSYFGLAGAAGDWLNRFLGWIFGQTRLLVPFLLVLLGVMVELQKDYPHDSRHFLGFCLLIFVMDGLIHLLSPVEDGWQLARQGLGGGFLGFLASYPLRQLLGFWATLVILGGLTVASLLLLFNTSLAALLQTQRNFFHSLGVAGKIITGVISLFIKKEPEVTGYGSEIEEDPLPPEFQKQTLKNNASDTLLAVANKNTNSPKENLMELTPPSKKKYRLPSPSLLTICRSQPTAGDIKANAFTIQKTLRNFGIEVEMGEIRVGPTVTQYSLKPADGVKLTRITALNNDLAMALAAHPIRIEAPIPGKSLVGVEVPNQRVATVYLRELLEAKEYSQNRHALNFALGRDVAGQPWFADLAALPHLLVAGATGSGKTVCLNTLILSLLFSHSSEILRFILIDPKRVELPMYNGIPHLLTPVITDTQKTVNALKWTIGEMERRFEILAKAGQRNINSYNRIMEKKIPYIVFVVDELADLMVAAGAEVEAGIIRLAQMARAVGIHLVLATQRPSVDIITGLIKANIPARIAFSVASLTDSRTILDAAGAEKLLGRGDMLWSPPELSRPRRLQSAFISEEDIKKVVDFLKADELPQYNDEIISKQQQTILAFGKIGNSDDDDPLLGDAREVITQAGKGSASLLQRRLKVGYARAARLLDLMEARGIIGPADGAKPREVLIKSAALATMAEDAKTIPIEDALSEEEEENDEMEEKIN